MIKGIIVSLIRLIHCFCHFELLDEMTYFQEENIYKKKKLELYCLKLSNTLLYLKHFNTKIKKIQHKIFAFKAPVIEKKKYLAILEKKNHLVNMFSSSENTLD